MENEAFIADEDNNGYDDDKSHSGDSSQFQFTPRSSSTVEVGDLDAHSSDKDHVSVSFFLNYFVIK